jgi:hypothetical protein
MPVLILHAQAQARVLEYALATASDNERDKAEEGVGSQALLALDESCANLREALHRDFSEGVTVGLDLLTCSVAFRYMEAIDGCADSLDEVSPKEFEEARRTLTRALSCLEDCVVPVGSDQQLCWSGGISDPVLDRTSLLQMVAVLARQQGVELQAHQLRCWCEDCDIKVHGGLRTKMSVCPECGDKRCRRAAHHDFPCSMKVTDPLGAPC